MRIDIAGLPPVSTFILAGGQGKRLFPLTMGKPKPLVPFGGAFRIIDFTLSNCLNSGLDRVHLLTQYRPDLIRQYAESSSWKTELVCLPPGFSSGYRGTADSVYQNLDLLRSQKTENLLVLAADHIYRMDYRALLEFHTQHGGDVTIAAVRYPARLSGELGVLEVDGSSRVVGFTEKPDNLSGASGKCTVLASMGVYVFKVPALMRALLRDAGNFTSTHEFGKDVMPHLLREAAIHAYDFSANADGIGNYWCDVGTIDSYFRSHMDLLSREQLFDPYAHDRWPIYAAGNAVMPGGVIADETNASLISPSARLSGASVSTSVVSALAEVEQSAEVQDSILLRRARVGKTARIRRAIVDEGVSIPDGEIIGFDPESDRQRFLVTRSGVVIVQAVNAAGFHKKSA